MWGYPNFLEAGKKLLSGTVSILGGDTSTSLSGPRGKNRRELCRGTGSTLAIQ